MSSDDDIEQSLHKMCQPFFREIAITAELNMIQKQPVPGVYVVPKSRNPFEWLGVVFIRQGLYQGAILRFTLFLPDDFPSSESPPRVLFEQCVFHPQIDSSNGVLQLHSAFPVWKKAHHHVLHVLLFIQRIFYKIDIQNALNEKAARLYEADPEQFRLSVSESVRRSRETVYDAPDSSDKHAIRFTPWDISLHEPVRTNILGQPKAPDSVKKGDEMKMAPKSPRPKLLEEITGVKNIERTGLSWFDPDRLIPMALDSPRTVGYW